MELELDIQWTIGADDIDVTASVIADCERHGVYSFRIVDLRSFDGQDMSRWAASVEKDPAFEQRVHEIAAEHMAEIGRPFCDPYSEHRLSARQLGISNIMGRLW